MMQKWGQNAVDMGSKCCRKKYRTDNDVKTRVTMMHDGSKTRKT